MREPPEGFVQRLKSTCGSDWNVLWNDLLGRWQFDSLSAGGKVVSQFWGWYKDQHGNPLEPDPVTGLYPFRDLDLTAQDEAIRNLQKTYIGKTGYGLIDWNKFQKSNIAYNQAVMQQRAKRRATLFADLIREMDIRRPWLKHHSGSKAERRVALSSS